MTKRRILLLFVAGLLSASALLAIAILLVGRFGSTEGKILGTTALLAAYGLLTLPATVLFDQRRFRTLAVAAVSLAAVGAAVALALVWSPSHPETVGKTLGGVTAFAVACAQVSALAARRRERDPLIVQRLFAVSCATVLVASSFFAAFMWTEPGGVYPRLFGALVVLDLLLVALQPLLARARPTGGVYRLRIVVDSGEARAVTIEGGDLAGAAAKAIRAVERDGLHVLELQVVAEEDLSPAGAGPR